MKPPFGTSHKNTFPSRNTTGPLKTSPSASLIPAVETDATCTGGGTSEARMFVSDVGRWLVVRMEDACSVRIDKWVRRVHERRAALAMVIIESGGLNANGVDEKDAVATDVWSSASEYSRSLLSIVS